MHVTGMSAMGPQAISGLFESDWHGDGLNVQPDGSKRFYVAYMRFPLERIIGLRHGTASRKKRAPMKELIVRMGGYFAGNDTTSAGMM